MNKLSFYSHGIEAYYMLWFSWGTAGRSFIYHMQDSLYHPGEMMATWPELALTSETGTNTETYRRIMELFPVISNNLGIMYTIVGELSHGVYVFNHSRPRIL